MTDDTFLPTPPNSEPFEAPTAAQPADLRRPRSVTLLALGVLSIAVLGLLRAYLAIREWQFLSTWPGVSPLYLAASGLAFALLGAVVFWALWWRKPWALHLTWAASLTFALVYWLDQIFVAERPVYDPEGIAGPFLPGNWLFAASATAILLLYTAWVVHRVDVKAYFGDMHE
jgi:hypothetical protein